MCDRDVCACVCVCVCVFACVCAPSGPIATGSGSREQRGVKGCSPLPVPIRLMAGDLLAFILMTAACSKAGPGWAGGGMTDRLYIGVSFKQRLLPYCPAVEKQETTNSYINGAESRKNYI